MHWLAAFDLQLFHLIYGLPHGPFLDAIAYAVHRATYGGLIYYPIAIYFLLQKDGRNRLFAKLGLVAGAISYLLTDVMLKHGFARLRPCSTLTDILCGPGVPLSYSFPSGQTATTFVAATLVILLYPENRTAKWLMLAWAALVALDRVYMGHHYPSDVAAGALIGTIVAWAAFRIATRAKARK